MEVDLGFVAATVRVGMRERRVEVRRWEADEKLMSGKSAESRK